MKKTADFALLWGFFLVLFYVASAFVSGVWNPTDWSLGWRFVYVCYGLFTMIFSAYCSEDATC